MTTNANASAEDDWERAQAELAKEGLSDGLPMVPPTAERVERMLRYNGFDPDEVVATLAPMYDEATWRDIATNAVMAGCRPEYLPVVGAAVAAVAVDQFNLLGIQTTTGNAASLIIVNGPIIGEIGMNAGGNALGPGNRANATIGRALRLVLQNVGGAKPGEMDMATLGQPSKFTFCLAENEAESPWPSLHAERGLAAGESSVTVLGTVGISEVVDSVSNKVEDLIRTYAHSMLAAGHVHASGLIGSGEPLLIIPPEHAVFFNGAGYTKDKLKSALFEEATLPLDRLSSAMRQRIAANRTEDGTDPAAPVRIAGKAADIMIVVAGGAGVKTAYVPTWGGSHSVTQVIRRRVV